MATGFIGKNNQFCSWSEADGLAKYTHLSKVKFTVDMMTIITVQKTYYFMINTEKQELNHLGSG